MSSLSINSFCSQTPAFRGKTVSNGSEMPYYKSDEGLKTGAILSIPAAANFLYGLRYKKPEVVKKEVNIYTKFLESGKQGVDAILKDNNVPNEIKELYGKIFNNFETNIENYKKQIAKKGKIAIPAALAAVACTMGTGALIDHVRNVKAEETSKQIVNAQSHGDLVQNENIQVDEKGAIYHHSKTGKGLGTLLGAGCGIVNYFLNKGLPQNAKSSLFINSVLFALGGLIVGSIYDKNVNKKSKAISREYMQIA